MYPDYNLYKWLPFVLFLGLVDERNGALKGNGKKGTLRKETKGGIEKVNISFLVAHTDVD